MYVVMVIIVIIVIIVMIVMIVIMHVYIMYVVMVTVGLKGIETNSSLPAPLDSTIPLIGGPRYCGAGNGEFVLILLSPTV